MRWQSRLNALLNLLLDKPHRPHGLIEALLLSGLYQLLYMRTPAHAVVSESVEAARLLGQAGNCGLVNAVLRRVTREHDVLLAKLERNPEARTAHPAWLLKRIQTDWPEHWQAIVAANNERAPLFLRVNSLKTTRDHYLKTLNAQGIKAQPSPLSRVGIELMDPADVSQLPGYGSGLFAVQDMAAQLATPLLHAGKGMRILDACAAPGGKTGHIVEMTHGESEVWAVDHDAKRMQRLTDNLARLGHHVQIKCADAIKTADWSDDILFDRILLDAPCSAVGVIRRHPDIKHLRCDAAITQATAHQAGLLDSLWPLLKPGGILLYVTCSILRQENDAIISAMIERHPDAVIQPIDCDWGHPTDRGCQVLPGEMNMDGFYFARLQKCTA